MGLASFPGLHMLSSMWLMQLLEVLFRQCLEKTGKGLEIWY